MGRTTFEFYRKSKLQTSPQTFMTYNYQPIAAMRRNFFFIVSIYYVAYLTYFVFLAVRHLYHVAWTIAVQRWYMTLEPTITVQRWIYRAMIWIYRAINCLIIVR